MTPDQIIALTTLAFVLGVIVSWGFVNFLDEVWSVARDDEEER